MQPLLVTCVQREWPDQVDVTYAGYTEMFDWGRQQRRILALAELHLTERVEDAAKRDHKGGDNKATSMKIDNLEWLDLEDCGDHVHASAYSGALTYSTKREIVVNYYD